jgi:ribonuclease-3
MEERVWLQRLQQELFRLLSPVVQDRGTLLKYLDAKAMPVWAKAFTHETYSPTFNYEVLEYLGDKVLLTVFSKYLIKRFPQFGPGIYTELNVIYMSGITQANIARQMGLGPLVRVRGLSTASLNLEGDVFESFFGALDTVADMVVPGMGLAVCFNFIVHLFRDIQIDPSAALGAPKTQVQQMFSRFGLGSPIESEYDEGGMVRMVVTPSPSQLQFLNQQGITLPFSLHWEATARTKKEAEATAYARALEYLNDRGATSTWAKNLKRTLELQQPWYDPYRDQALRRARAAGFQSIAFFMPRKTNSSQESVVQLIGIRPNKQEETLESYLTSNKKEGFREGKVAVLAQYARGQ